MINYIILYHKLCCPVNFSSLVSATQMLTPTFSTTLFITFDPLPGCTLFLGYRCTNVRQCLILLNNKNYLKIIQNQNQYQ